MYIIQRWARVAALVCAMLATSIASAVPITSLVVFGDSLSDPGNAASLTGNLFPGTPTGRFSNGPVAAEYLAQQFGILGANPTNFAVGGATTGTQNFNFVIDNPPGLRAFAPVGTSGIANQIAGYTPGAAFDAASTLFLLWGGPNDIFLATALGQDIGNAALQAIQNIVTGLTTLVVAKGAQNILIPNLPDLGLTPQFVGDAVASAQATALTNAFNGGLAQALALAEAQYDALGFDVNILQYDTAAFLRSTVAGTTFSNETEACISSALALASNCAGYLFFDTVHPTTAAHRLLAGEFAAAVPEPGTYALLAIGLLAFGVMRRQRA